MKLKDIVPHSILPHAKEDAIGLLRADHDAMEDMFYSFDQIKHGRDYAEKKRLVRDLCRIFRIHSTLEEEIFYPAVRAEVADDDLMNEALVEHEGAEQLVAGLETMDAADEMLNATMHVLCAYIKHHVREEEQDMFPKARDTELDMDALGVRMNKRRKQLLEGIERTGRLPAPRKGRQRTATTEPRIIP
jgi:hypothetical protein